MKKFISIFLVVCILTGLTGCITQDDLDILNAQIAELEKDLSNANKEIQTLKGENAQLSAELKDTSAELKEANEALDAANSSLDSALSNIAELETQLENALNEVDELKNGPDRALAAIRNAYDAKNWTEVITLANALHAKYPGLNQDIEAQGLAATAQKTLDDEKAQAEAEAAKTLEDKVHNIIRITKLSCSSPNSAGGVGINLHFVNMHPEKTIKYLYVTVYPYNAVGDMMDCDIRGYSSYTCEATGPYAPGQGINASTGWWWPNAWYNWNIKTIELSNVRIVYTDGTSITLTSQERPYAIW